MTLLLPETAAVGCPRVRVVGLGNEGNEVVACLGVVITQLISEPNGGQVTKFDYVRPPSASVKDYLLRLWANMGCSPECFVLSIIYINRFLDSNHGCTLNAVNVHRLLMTTTVIAAKVFDDKHWSNGYYARVGGVTTTELNYLEISFLISIGWKTFVAPEECAAYLATLRLLQSCAADALQSNLRLHSMCQVACEHRSGDAAQSPTATNSCDAGMGEMPMCRSPAHRSVVVPTKRWPSKVSRRNALRLTCECSLDFLAKLGSRRRCRWGPKPIGLHRRHLRAVLSQ